jgi:hypothetical protein
LDGQQFGSFSLSSSSDNGPDSGPGDNTRVTIGSEEDADPFQSITLSPSAGAVSLEGGGDYSSSVGPNDTLFSVDSEFADDLSCLETRPAALFGGSALDALVTRLDNEDDCEDIGINFEILDDGVLLEKTGEGLETGTPQPVRAQVTIYWTPFPAEAPTPWRQVNFTPDDDETWVDVQWCLGQDEDGLWEHPANTPWCLISDYSVLNEDGQIEQVQVYDGAGDPMWR